MIISLPASTAGLASTAFVTGISGQLHNQISASSAGVSMLNGQSGALTLVGTGFTQVNVSGQTVFISSTGGAGGGGGNTNVQVSGSSTLSTANLTGGGGVSVSLSAGSLVTISDATTVTNLGTTGSALYSYIQSVSGDGRTIQSVTQVAHGFSGGQAIYNSGSTWYPALATSSVPALGIVETSGSSSTFTVVTAGLINLGAGQFAANTPYYVSDKTAGYLVNPAPTGATSFYDPILYTVSSSVGYVIPSWPASLSLVGNSSLAQMPPQTLKANPAASSGAPSDITVVGNGGTTASFQGNSLVISSVPTLSGGYLTGDFRQGVAVTSGVTSQTFNFSSPFLSTPLVLITLVGSGTTVVAAQLTGVTPTGFGVVYSGPVPNGNYQLDYMATTASGTSPWYGQGTSKTAAIGFSFDAGAGNVLTTYSSPAKVMVDPGTLLKWFVRTNTSGTVTLDLQKASTTGAYASVTNGNFIAITGNYATGSASTWNTSFAVGDSFIAVVSGTPTPTLIQNLSWVITTS